MIRLLKEEDKKIVLEYLLRNEIETSFLYSNVIEFGIENQKEFERCAYYYGFFINNSLKGILPVYNLGSCIPHYESVEAIPSFVSIMKESNYRFLIGMERIVKPIYEEIKNTKNIEEYNESSYFVNKNYTPYIINELEFIDPSKMADDEKIIDFIIQVRSNGFHEKVNSEDVKKLLSIKCLEEDKVIAVKKGKMVAYAIIQAFTNTINQIGSVYTVEGERGNGYCKAVISELCRRILLREKTPTLFVKKNNIPAVKAYTSIGFEHFDDYLFIKFK